MEKKIYIRMTLDLFHEVQVVTSASRITVWRAATFKSNGPLAMSIREYLLAHGGVLVAEEVLPTDEYKGRTLPEIYNEYQMKHNLNTSRI